MTTANDSELLRLYVSEHSEPAFAELVQRHLNAVYAVALRQVGGDAHLARDIAQVVFATLARKATTLLDRPALGGWLFVTTHYAARDVVRSERRRRIRERETALELTPAIDVAADVDWEGLRRVLDEMMTALKEPDRAALWLRFFEGCSFADVGVRLRVTENAARMRVERALEKLRASLRRRGVDSTIGAVAFALSNQAGAAPTGLAAIVAQAACASAGAAGALVVAETFLTMSKIKIGLVSLLAVASAGTAIREVWASQVLRDEIDHLRTARDEGRQLHGKNQVLVAALAKSGAERPDLGELARLRGRIAKLKARPEGVLDSEMKPAAAWRNAGNATPADAYETMQWAQSQENIGAFAEFIRFGPRGKAKLDAFFANLPESVRLEFGSAENMIALNGPARTNHVAFQVLGQTEHGIKVTVHAWVRDSSGQERRHDMLLQRYEDGWRAAAFPEEMTENIIRSLDPATGKRLPKTK
jgi:RNA polymerase sigma factor (sigma-70 family)